MPDLLGLGREVLGVAAPGAAEGATLHKDDRANPAPVVQGEALDVGDGCGGHALLACLQHVLGAVDNVNEWLSAVDCLLMPSLFEGLPFVLVEAQAAGLPCVVSSSVSEEANISGYLQYVSLDDPLDSWMESVIYAAQSPRYNAEKKIIDAGYSIEDSVREVTELIKNA